MGHYLNDLVASMWFNYLLIYLKEINPIAANPSEAGFYAGLVMLLA